MQCEGRPIVNEPVLPSPVTLTAEERSGRLALLRRFHFGDPAARDALVSWPGELRPALLHRFLGAKELRTDFPVHLRVAGGLECTPLRELLEGAITAAARQLGDARFVLDNRVRAERIVRDALTERGGTAPADELLATCGEALDRKLELAGPSRSRLLEQWQAVVQSIPPGGQLIGLDAQTPLRIFAMATRAVVPARRREFRAELERLRDGLRAILDLEGRKDPNARAPDAVRGSIGAVGAALFDPAALARVVGDHRGTLRLDERRRVRVGEALLALDSGLEAGEDPLLTVIGAPGSSDAGDDLDIEMLVDAAPCRAARARHDRDAERMAKVFRAVRLARLEIDGAYDPDRHDAWLAAFGPDDFSPEESMLVPTVVVVDSVSRLAGDGMVDLSALLLAGRPIQVLALAAPLESELPAGALPITPHHLELAYLGIAHRGAFVQQSAAARPVHLARGFSTALAEACPGLHVVMTASGRTTSWIETGAAIEGRAHPLLRYDPRAGSTWARRLDFGGNPAIEEDWPAGEFTAVAGDGTPTGLAQHFTFADHALLQPAFAAEFALIDPEFDDAALVSVAEWTAVESDGPRRELPFVWAVDAGGVVRRLVVSRRLLAACRDRLDFWRTLQELAGVRNAYVREAVALAQDEAARQAELERAKRDDEHAAELEAVRARAVAEAMDGLARSLLELDAMAPESRPRSTAKPAPAAPAVAASPAVENPAVERPAAEQTAAEPKPDAIEFEEPWIDTPLCTSCNDCCVINPLLFVYDANKQARIGDPQKGTFAQLVKAAEKCPAKCIHPGVPLDPKEAGLADLVARAAPFNR